MTKLKTITKLKIKVIIFTAFFMLFAIKSINAQQNAKTSSKDFKILVGSWEGTLTYLDYTSGKSYSMPANLEIKQLGKTKQFIFSNIYPNEPKANSSDTLTISIDGKFIGKKAIKSKKKLQNGEMEIIAEEKGKDGNDNKNATFRHTYTISKTIFKRRKDIQFEGENTWINRHEYSYKIKSNK